MNNHIVMIKKFNIGVLGFIWTRVVTWRWFRSLFMFKKVYLSLEKKLIVSF
jgi:hypothetical protein